MTNEKVSHEETRYYQADPNKITPHACESHGADHAAYGWTTQLDPRWSDECIKAYRYGYEQTKDND